MKNLAFLVFFLLLPSAHAQERVLDFHSDIRIARNGELTVTERITVRAEGASIRRGILRDFPTGYRDGLGNKVNVPFQVLKVARNGQPEPFALERLANGTRIRIGSGSVQLPRGEHTYTIVYRTARQLGFFDEHDELYWNVNGNGWSFAFERLSAEVTLPQPIAATLVRTEAYTGLQGARGRSYAAFTRDGGAGFRATRALQPREGMTIVVSFPKGIVEEPSRMQRARWWIADNRGAFAGFGGFGLLFLFLYWRWSLVGRDPRAGPRFPRYDPPPGVGPAGARYVHRMGFDDACFAAALVGLGQRGFLTIEQKGERYGVRRTGTLSDWLPGEKALAEALLPREDSSVWLGKTHDPVVQGARASFAEALSLHFGARLFSKNHGSMLAGLLLAVAVLAAMLALDASDALVFGIGGLMVLMLLLFKRWMPAYSVEGRRMADHIAGLRRYLSVAEADELRRMKAPPQTAEEFARLFPYAVALGVERTWANRFTQLLGASAVAAAAGNYYASDRGFSSAGGISESIATLGETLSAATTPPGSTSGSSSGGSSSSGSGGSSGGGGGGGGGSGW